jgi:transcription termination/antitermination protein NusG
MDHSSHSAPKWFALRVKSRHEQVVSMAVRGKGFDEFLPLYAKTARWSDRTKITPAPLFPGYVFCRLSAGDRFPILTIPGTLHFVANGKELVPISEEEITAIRTAVRAKLNLEPIAFLATGRKLLLNQGPLAGVQGFLVETPKRKFVISLNSLQRSVAVDMKEDWAGSIQKTAEDINRPPEQVSRTSLN